MPATGAATITEPRDYLTISSSVREIGLTLRYAGKGLADAWEYAWPSEPSGEQAGRVALGTLRQARADLDAVIAELAGVVGRESEFAS